MLIKPSEFMEMTRLKWWLIPWMNTRYKFGTVKPGTKDSEGKPVEATGGDDPIEGVDCSGFVSQYCQAFGLMPHGLRLTAEGLLKYFTEKGCPLLSEASAAPREGCLQFITTQTFPGDLTPQLIDFDKIQHVNICIGGNQVVGAMRGTANTVTELQAALDNAFVQGRPYDYWKNVTRIYLDPMEQKEN